jgi:5-methyltetrahydrofolate--homocysteine methyltransferase
MSSLATMLKSASKTVKIHRDEPTTIIGERINPTGRKQVLEALAAESFDLIRRDAVSQVEAGAAVLDVNAGVPGLDEVSLLPRLVEEVMAVVDVPLCIDSANPRALEAALRCYPGKALINSTNGEEKNLEAVLPLAKQFGAAVIGLCMDEKGIPAASEGRMAIAEKILDRAAKHGIPMEDVILDPLAMTMGANSKAGLVTLQTIELIVREWGVNVTLGASNISFGLPDRKLVNANFLAMAIYAGLTCPITNPLVTEVHTAVLAADLSMGRDPYGMRWVKDYRKRVLK